MSPFIQMISKVFGKWTVLSRDENSDRGQPRYLCQCLCGKQQVHEGGNLRKMRPATECKGHQTKHGMSHSREYITWEAMMQRCTNTNHEHYHHYGGRGITVCERWQKFENFYADMGDRPQGKTLERIDNEKCYCKTNCTWATPKEHARNRRNTRMLTYKGKTQCQRDWGRELNLSEVTIHKRLKRGLSVEQALSTPAGRKRGSSQ